MNDDTSPAVRKAVERFHAKLEELSNSERADLHIAALVLDTTMPPSPTKTRILATLRRLADVDAKHALGVVASRCTYPNCTCEGPGADGGCGQFPGDRWAADARGVEKD